MLPDAIADLRMPYKAAELSRPLEEASKCIAANYFDVYRLSAIAFSPDSNVPELRIHLEIGRQVDVVLEPGVVIVQLSAAAAAALAMAELRSRHVTERQQHHWELLELARDHGGSGAAEKETEVASLNRLQKSF